MRGNGGGLIYAAEQLLQLLTPRAIEPQSAQFVNTPLNLRICRKHRRSTRVDGLVLEPWIDSIEQAVADRGHVLQGVPDHRAGLTPTGAASTTTGRSC